VYQVTQKPQVIAHRGYSGVYPENTVSAILGAIALGVDMVELDVRLSRDRVPVIFHNASLLPITACHRYLEDLSVQELKELDVGIWRDEAFRGERIPTLDEVLSLTRGRIPVNLDIKTPAAIAPVIASVQGYRMLDEVVLSGCSWAHARKVRQLESGLHVLMNVDGLLRTLLRLLSARLALLLSRLQARTAQPMGLNIGHSYAAERFIRDAAASNLPIWTWTVDDPLRAKQLASLGAISITSNWPDRIMHAL
jgi:glycerophosphoryl diester phosphodiesterase